MVVAVDVSSPSASLKTVQNFRFNSLLDSRRVALEVAAVVVVDVVFRAIVLVH